MVHFPSDIDSDIQGIISALSFRFSRKKPGLETDDLIQEALKHFQYIKQMYDPTKDASLKSLAYQAIRNIFLNTTIMKQNKINTQDICAAEPRSHTTETIDRVLEKHIPPIFKEIKDTVAEKVLQTLLTPTEKKKTTKQICTELGITFYKYQQAENIIRRAIKQVTRG